MKRAFVALILTLSCLAVQAQAPATSAPSEPATSTSQIAERVDALAMNTLASPVAGISIAVARDGKVIFARGYGVANLEHAVPVSPDTVFHIASISKNILAAVI